MIENGLLEKTTKKNASTTSGVSSSRFSIKETLPATLGAMASIEAKHFQPARLPPTDVAKKRIDILATMNDIQQYASIYSDLLNMVQSHCPNVCSLLSKTFQSVLDILESVLMNFDAQMQKLSKDRDSSMRTARKLSVERDELKDRLDRLRDRLESTEEQYQFRARQVNRLNFDLVDALDEVAKGKEVREGQYKKIAHLIDIIGNQTAKLNVLETQQQGNHRTEDDKSIMKTSTIGELLLPPTPPGRPLIPAALVEQAPAEPTSVVTTTAASSGTYQSKRPPKVVEPSSNAWQMDESIPILSPEEIISRRPRRTPVATSCSIFEKELRHFASRYQSSGIEPTPGEIMAIIHKRDAKADTVSLPTTGATMRTLVTQILMEKAAQQTKDLYLLASESTHIPNAPLICFVFDFFLAKTGSVDWAEQWTVDLWTHLHDRAASHCNRIHMFARFCTATEPTLPSDALTFYLKLLSSVEGGLTVPRVSMGTAERLLKEGAKMSSSEAYAKLETMVDVACDMSVDLDSVMELCMKSWVFERCMEETSLEQRLVEGGDITTFSSAGARMHIACSKLLDVDIVTTYRITSTYTNEVNGRDLARTMIALGLHRRGNPLQPVHLRERSNQVQENLQLSTPNLALLFSDW
eukprot:CAMPEP_0184658512 /NCGR_PEP_ID=MMETSP0308-20130426/25699_1 /TAXON_ID=38269 /ORGANISM="Gloeochaete witrockiana, Strain SAG 46.84" /LENGTH=637 /DNA_ID=CAMNT_0027097549 /DNA_START=15 /DNA_END=1926 /DNA_ORIENTATION=+